MNDIGRRLQAQQDAEDAAKYRALQTPEAIDRLAFALYSMGVYVPPRDTAFFQAAVSRWLSVNGGCSGG